MTYSGTKNRFGQSRLDDGKSIVCSNTRFALPQSKQGQTVKALRLLTSVNLGLNSERARGMMIERLRAQGIEYEPVLAAMRQVPRHIFVDQGLASRAYENNALPIGYGQTISQPFIVARMIALACYPSKPQRVLEIGAGCGYQAAVLAQMIETVHTIERIYPLYQMAQRYLEALGLKDRVRLKFADGQLGWEQAAPFDAIIIAAAGKTIPQHLLYQLAIGGRLIAPIGTTQQRLAYIQRTAPNHWQKHELEAVRFVPLKSGIQI